MYQVIDEFRKEYKAQIEIWNKQALAIGLGAIQKQVALDAGTPEYSLDTPVVYNRDLDKITSQDDIKLIVIGDNPGKDEQLAINNRYLVGQAGKIGEGFFRRNPDLGIDFRKNVIILNKTPVHSAKTNQLKKIEKLGGKAAADLILESQLWMAKRTAKLLEDLVAAASKQNKTLPELWLIGYGELKGKGLFLKYRDELKNSLEGKTAWNQVFVFQHFSMNRFTIDLGEQVEEQELQDMTLSQQIHTVGQFHKKEIFL